MGFFHEYPYTDFHEINLDWLIALVRKLDKSMSEFEAINAITFGGAWDISTAYEPWTIVTVNNTAGYISIKPVPAGIQYDNTEYWTMIVDYTASVEDLRKTVDRLANRFFVFLGDSYSIGTSGGSPVTNFGWVDQVITNLQLTSDQYIRCTQAEIGMLPAFYPSVPNVHTSWRESIETIRNRMTDEEAEKTTDLVVAGGYNETFGNNIDATWQGMIDFMSYARQEFPNATVWLGEIGYNTNSTAGGISARNFIIVNVIPTYEKAARLGFRVMEGTSYLIWNRSQMSSDGIHPTESCYQLLGEAITNNLLGTGYEGDFGSIANAFSITPASGVTFTVDGAKYFVKNTRRLSWLRFEQTVITLANPIDIEQNTAIVIGSNDSDYFLTGLSMLDFGVVPVVYVDTSNNRYLLPSRIVIDTDNNWKVISPVKGAQGQYSGLQVKNVLIQQFTKDLQTPYV